MLIARADASVGSCGNTLRVIGGDSAGFTDDHAVYNVVTDTWSSDLSIPGGLGGSGTEVQAISGSGRIFIVGGGISGIGVNNPTQNIFKCS